MTETDNQKRQFGIIAIKKRLASKEQIMQALQEQKRQARQGNTVLFGDTLVLLNVITEEQKEQILETQKILQNKIEEKAAAQKSKASDEAKQETDSAQPAEPEEAPPDLENAKKVQNGSGFELAVTPDRLQAYIYPIEDNTTGVGLDTIKNLMETEAVSYGVVEDEKISTYLEVDPAKNQYFKIAHGQPTDPGKPTEMKYYFDIDFLKPGTVDESGKMDFKNRGKIPWVKTGDPVAEIVPGTEGKPGTDIYGMAIEPPPPDILSLKCGKNVKREEEGIRAFSEIDGRPELQEDGTIDITDTLPIAGDVGIETGNIEFPGHLEVKGAIQEGYTVKCRSVTANEVHNALIETQGDIVITKGIIGAKIRTEGTVKARHIRDTTIDAVGDVTVEKEVYESHIESNGIFRIERGKIMGSSISAMKGVEAQDIGSAASDPCTVITGIDNRLENQVTSLNMQIATREKEAEKLRNSLKEILDKPKKLDDEIGKLAQKQDEAMRKGVSLKETLKSLQKANDKKNIKKVLTITKALNHKLKQLQTRIDELVKQQEEIEGKISKYNEYISRLEKEVEDLQDDIKSIVELAKIRQPSSGVRVTGTVYDRSSIRGRNASMIVKGNLHRVHFQEIKNTDEKSDQHWLMSVASF